jgi:signal recognition particle subunit SRP54
MLGSLGDNLRDTVDKIKDAVFVDDSLVKEVTKDIQRSLMQADVDIELVMELAEAIKERAGEEPPAGLTKKELLIQAIYEEIADILGEDGPDVLSKITESDTPYVVMLVGLFGAGKTTTAAKLAYRWKQHGKRVAMVSTDTWRPAAKDQLKQLGDDIDVDVYTADADEPEAIYEDVKSELSDYDAVLVDTAGRDSLNDDLQDELTRINDAVQPDESLLVLSADTGQGAKGLATTFADRVDVTGVIMTKMDGTAKGGGALTACHAAAVPVYYLGVGEDVKDLESFESERFVGRLLGMGDLEGLLEKSRQAFSEEEAEDLTEKMMSGDFTLRDLYKQLEGMQSMGALDKIVDMIPGMGDMGISKEELQAQEENMEEWQYLMDSMTEEELENPDCIRKSRRKRIAAGAGVDEQSLRDLLQRYRQTKKMMKKMGGGGGQRKLQKMMKQMQGGGGGNLPF